MNLNDFKQEICIIMTTEVDKENASKLANLLLREKLIPCVNFNNIESYYWWEGDIHKSKEVQLIIKCKKENVIRVCKKISEWHSYNIPEIIYFDVSTNKNYHNWVNSI
tara:strand:+ start:810 stop:1133 length:324 start_codon:yes stop_codon:yes gene_type:complete